MVADRCLISAMRAVECVSEVGSAERACANDKGESDWLSGAVNVETTEGLTPPLALRLARGREVADVVAMEVRWA